MEFTDLNDFFGTLESVLCLSLKSFAAKIVDGSKQQDFQTNDVRVLLELYVKHWNHNETISKKIKDAPINATHFKIVKDGLNKWHHKEPTHWTILQECVTFATNLLTALEKDVGEYAVDTSSYVAQLQTLWARVQKTSSKAFSNAREIIVEDVTEEPVLEESKQFQFIITNVGSSIEPEKLLVFLRDSLDIFVRKYERLNEDKLVVTVEGQRDLERALEDGFIKYKGSKLLVEAYVQTKYVVTLQNVPDDLTEVKLSEHLQDTCNITPTKTTIDRATRFAVLELKSEQDKNSLLSDGFSKYKGVKMPFVDGVPKAIAIIVYMLRPVDPTDFMKKWHDTYNFSIEGRSVINNSTLEARIYLQSAEINQVKGDKYFKVAGEKFPITQASNHRVKLLLPENVCMEEVQSSLLNHIVSSSDVEDIILLGTFGVVHLSNSTAKATLLKEKKVLIKPTVSAIEEKQPNAPSVDQPPPSSNSFYKAVLLSPIPKKMSSLQLMKLLADNGLDCSFVTLRNGNGYAEYRNESIYKRALEKASITYNNTSVKLSCYNDKVPYWSFFVLPVPDTTQIQTLLGALNAAVPGVRYGYVERTYGVACVPVGDVYTLRRVSKAKYIDLHGRLAYILNEGSLKSSDILTKTLPITDDHRQYLEKRKDDLKALRHRHSVHILLPPSNDNAKEDNTVKAPTNAKDKTAKKVGVKEKELESLTKPKLKNAPVLIVGTRVEEVTLAGEEFRELLKPIQSKRVPYSFSKAEMATFFRQKLLATLPEASDIVTEVTLHHNVVTVNTVGPAALVDEFLGGTDALHAELTFESKQLPASTKLDVKDLEKQYDVIIDFDHQTAKATVYGTQDTVAAVLGHFNSLLGSVAGSDLVNLPKWQYKLFELYIYPDMKQLASTLNLEVTLKDLKIFIKGTNDHIQQFKKQVLARCFKMKSAKFKVQLDKKLSWSALLNYLKQQFKDNPVYFYCEEVNPVKVAKHTKEDDEVTSTSSTSTEDDDSEVDKPKQSVSFSVQYWFIPEEGLEDKIKTILSAMKACEDKLALNSSQSKAIGKINFKSIQIQWPVQVLLSQKYLVVLGFDNETVAKACQAITKLLEAKSTSVAKIALTADAFKFFKSRKQLETWQEEYNLRIKLSFEEKVIELFGNQAKVTRVKEEIEQLLSTLKKKKFNFEKKDRVTKKELFQTKQELEESYNIHVHVDEHALDIVGPTTEDWDGIEKQINELRLEQIIHKPSESTWKTLQQLIFFDKEVDLMKFKEDWNLRDIYFDRPEFEKDAKQAIQALEALGEQKQIASVLFKFGTPVIYSVIARKMSPFYKQYRKIAEDNNVTFQDKKSLKVDTIFIRGNRSDAQKALMELQQLVLVASSQIANKQIEVSKVFATELTRDNSKLIWELLKNTDVYLSLPEWNKNMLVAELVGKNGFTIQIIDGNLLHETTDCIVNSANELLQHAGGVALAIAKKAGAKLEEESKALIAKMKTVPTGAAVLTTAGNLPFKAVIHAVGPVWKGGTAKEQDLLQQALLSVLQLGNARNFQSISVPAISAGLYGYPPNQCADTLIGTCLNYILTASPQSTLKVVRFCDTDKTMVSMLEQSLLALGKNMNITQVNKVRPATDVAYQWYWREDNGQFLAFDPDQNYQIEVAYIKQNHKGKLLVTGDINKQKNNSEYEIDFDAMTEINTSYRRNPRSIKRVASMVDNFYFSWEVETNSGWTPLVGIDRKQTELAYQRKTIPFITISWNDLFSSNNNNQAQIHFKEMQLHCGNSKYKVRRRTLDYEEEMLLHLASETPTEQFSTKSSKTTKALLSGLKSDLGNGEKMIQDLIKKMTVAVTIKIDRKLPTTELKDIQAIATAYGGEVTYTETSGIVVTSLESVISQARAEISEYLLSKSSSNSAVYPSHWEPQKEQCELKPLKRGSAEWNDIEKSMQQTLPSVNILKIERVQNKLLWEKYMVAKQFLERKNNGNANEIRLFHGSRGTQPSMIYLDEAGFDMRHCNSGMWGIAIYFAMNASYSASYSFQTPEKYNQIFMPRVLVGDSIHIMPNNTSLRKPPAKKTENGMTTFYDAVSGETGNTKIYMIYENGRAYPDYLITYA